MCVPGHDGKLQDNMLERERNAIRYVLEMIKDDGGPQMDTLEGSLYRLKLKLQKCTHG